MNDKLALAERVRQACLQHAIEAYEQAGISGLCDEGRFEVAIDAIRQLDIAKLIESPQD
ncbi:MAG: acetyltransferase [Thiohalophilus sp.]